MGTGNMRYWICVTSKENWEIVKKEGIWAVPSNRKAILERVKPNDRLVIYVSSKSIGGIFEVVSKPYEDKTRIFTSRKDPNEVFPYRVKIKPLIVPKEPVSFAPLVHKLSFIKKKEGWTAYFRRAMFEISEEDFKVIEKYLRETT